MGQFCHSIGANLYFAATKAEANAIASSFLLAQAEAFKFCCDLTDLICCVGDTVTQTYTIMKGTGPFDWQYTGTLVGNLTLSLSDGGRTLTVSGVPVVAGPQTLSFTITDLGTGAQIPKTLLIQAIEVDNAILADGTPGTAYSHQFTASGASGGYIFTVGTGSLPPGLTLDIDGRLHGTPTTPGTFPFQICVTPI